MKHRARAALTALLLVAIAFPALARQSSEPLPRATRTLAIHASYLVTAPGQVIENGTLVIRDGLVTAVGSAAVVPFDAQVVEADSMWVYPGFIDAFSFAGVPAPEVDPNAPSVDDPGNPPPGRAGIRPQRDVRSLLDSGDASLAQLRSAGFTAAHVVPRDGMLPGTGSIVLLRGSSPESMVLRGPVSAVAQYAGARGVYPGTPMAIAATIRQMAHETARRTSLEERYADNPTGLPPPPWNAEHEAFARVVSGELPVFFQVNSALEAHRALDLASELGFRLVLTGVNEGYALPEKLARAGLPLVVTLDLPDRPDWMAKIKADSLSAVADSFDPELRTATWRDTEAEIANLRARQVRSRSDYAGNAGALHAAGLAFAFSTANVEGKDVLPNLRAMVSEGLPADVALAGLTTHAAEILGMSGALGTLEPGKLGNLVIASGPLFEEETEILHVVVAGELFDIERPKKSGEEGSGEAGFVGRWSVTVDSPEGLVTGTFTFTGDEDALSVALTYDRNPDTVTVERVTRRGDQISLSFPSPDGMVSMELTRDGDSISGTVVVEGAGTMQLDGDRVPPGAASSGISNR